MQFLLLTLQKCSLIYHPSELYLWVLALISSVMGSIVKSTTLAQVLIDWINDVLVGERIIVKDLAEDLYDGQVLQKLFGKKQYLLFVIRL